MRIEAVCSLCTAFCHGLLLFEMGSFLTYLGLPSLRDDSDELRLQVLRLGLDTLSI